MPSRGQQGAQPDDYLETDRSGKRQLGNGQNGAHFDNFLASEHSHLSVNSSFGGTAQRSATKEEVQLLSERLFAQEKQLQRQALDMQEIVQRHEKQLHALESKIDNKKVANGPAVALEEIVQRHETQLRALESKFDNNKATIRSDVAPGDPDIHARVEAIHARVDSTENQFAHNARVDHIHERVDNLEATHGQYAQKEHVDGIHERVNKMESIISNAGLADKEEEPDLDSIDRNANHAELDAYRKSILGSYVFDESIWDLSTLIGSPCLGAGASIQVVVLLLTNILMQIIFLIVCYFYFLDAAIDDSTVESTIGFRNFDAHHDRYLGYGTSLAERLCVPEKQPSDPIGLVIGSYQNSVTSDITTYLKEGDEVGPIESIFNGEMMCILALSCWVTSVMVELNTLMNFALAVTSLKSHHRSIFLYKDEGIRLLCASPGRKLLVLIGIGIRFCIAVTLTIFGCMWLGGTDGITDLLLNAVALGFILAIPETLYEALIADNIKTVFGNVAPLKRPHWPHLGRGCDIKTMFDLIFLPSLVTVSYVVCCLPMVTDMRAVWDEMCKGPLDFTYAHDALTRVQLSDISKDTGALYTPNLTVQAIRDKIDGKTHGPEKWNLYANPEFIVETVFKVSTESFPAVASEINPSCIDMIKGGNSDQKAFQVRAVILQQMGIEISHCRDIAEFCSQTTFQGKLARAACSETCGCDTPLGIHGNIDPSAGCPHSCQHTTRYRRAGWHVGCHGIRHVIDKPFWASWANYMDRLAAFPGKLQGVGDAMRMHGCNFTHNIEWGRRSAEDIQHHACRGELPGDLRPMAHVCPVFCKCHIEEQIESASGNCHGGSRHCITVRK